MTLAEKLVVKANKVVMEKARKQGIINEVILETIAEDTETRIKYLIDNSIITLEELNTALNK